MYLAERHLLEDDLRRITAFVRPSASEGEARAATLLADSLRVTGAEVEIETDRVVGNYWLPLGILSAAGLLSGVLAARRAARPLAVLLGAAAAAGVWGDVTAQRRWIRRPLPKRDTTNVLAWFGPRDAERTVVVSAHHDAAKSGLIFNPAVPDFAWRMAPDFMAANAEGPPVMVPVAAAPLLSALASATGSRRLGIAATGIAAIITAVFVDIALRRTVPGANDNATGVVTLQALARRLAVDPPKRTRVLLLSTGSEESLLEGMGAFARRWFPRLDRDNTFFLGVDTVGSGELCALHGEGMIRMREYPRQITQMIEEEGRRLGIGMLEGLRHRNSTDSLFPLQAGYPTAMIGSVDERRMPANYHWRSDVCENVDMSCLADAVELCDATVRRLDERWLS